MTYDFIIVGGGLSGLYHAHQYNKRFPKKKIHLFHDRSRLGGRIYTHEFSNGEKVNMGAGRIATHHEKTMKLIRNLKLEKDLIPLGNIPKSLDTLKHFPSEEEALMFLQNVAKTAIHKIPKKYMTSMTFQKIIKFFFSKKVEKVQEAIFVSGYDTEFEFANAWIMCHSIMDMFGPKLKFATLRGGLERITKGLIESLKKKKNVKFHTKCPVIGWRKTDDNKAWQVFYHDRNHSQEKREFQIAIGEHLHIATALKSWQSWMKDGTIENVPVTMDAIVPHVQPVSLCRVYATYEDTNWIKAIEKCVTHSQLRYIIPINETTIMISYIDGEQADAIADFDDEQIKDWIKDGIQQAFPGLNRFIPEPLEIKKGYWKVGVHIWKPSKNVQPPTYIKSDDETFSMSGEAFSKFHQGWMEGALQTHTDPPTKPKMKAKSSKRKD